MKESERDGLAPEGVDQN